MSHENFSLPCSRPPLQGALFEGGASPSAPPRTWAHKGHGAARPWALVALEFMDPDKMTTAGMLVWAAIFTVVGLVASYFIAIGWQRWKDKGKA